MRKNLLFLLFFLSMLVPALVKSQNMQFARSIIDTLSSDYFFGRGYIKNGDNKAALFIKDKLIQFNVNAFNNQYLQPFPISVNTFPGRMMVAIDEDTLKPAFEYITDPSSIGNKGQYKIAHLSKDVWFGKKQKKQFLNADYSQKFIQIDTTGIKNELYNKLKQDAFNNQFDAAGYILPGKYKPMYYISQKQAKATIIQIDTEKLNTESKQIDIAIDQEFKPNYKTQNVIGYIQGKSDSIIMFTAHYDHLGGMGNKVFFPGANDNCSGVSMLLSLAEYYNTNKIKPEYTLVFAFLSAEEVGLRGSMYMALHPPFNLKRVKFLFNLDLVGTGSEGIQIVNSTVFDKEYNLLCKLNDKNSYLKQIKKRGEAANSDHYPFYAIGIPAFFIYTLGGTSEYHNPLDISKTLPLTKYKELFSLLTDFIDNYE